MKTRFCYIRLCALAAILALACVSQAWSQRAGDYGAQAATPLGNTHYYMTTTTDKEAPPQYTYFKFYSDGNTVTQIWAHIEFDDTKLNFVSVDTTFFNWDQAATFTVTSGVGYVFVQISNIPARTFGVNDSLLKFTWNTECFTDGTNITLSMDTTATGGRNNQFVSGGNSYYPTHITNGYVGIYQYTGSIWGYDITKPAGHDAKVPFYLVNNFDPRNGFYVRIYYNQSKMQFIGWDTLPGYSAYCIGGEAVTVDTSGNGDTIYIESNCLYSMVASPEPFINLKFNNRMTTDQDSGYVVVDTAMMLDDCEETQSLDASEDTSWVVTPKYTASIKYKSGQQIATGTSGNIELQLRNSFEVDMDAWASDEQASFKTKNTAWTKLQYQNYSPTYTSRDSLLKWLNTNSTGDRIYASNYGAGLDNIPPASGYYTVMTQQVLADTTPGYQVVGFTRAAYGETGYGSDSKLHSTFLDITIHSIDDVNYDSLFALEKDSVQLYTPSGGGSCPFVYTWDGSDFVLEDAILTASEKLAEGTSVTDYLPLMFKPALEDGKYLLRIHEQEAEKTFLDDAELMIIDHAPGFTATVSTEGEVIFGNGQIHPTAVVDDQGSDVTDFVSANDDKRFEHNGTGSLIASFNRREGELYVIAADDSTEGGKGPCDVRNGPFAQVKPELLSLRIEVEDAQGVWHELPTGPDRLPATRLRPVINLASYDLPMTFRIRYTYDGDFSLDEIALAVQVPVTHVLTQVSAKGVLHSSDHPSAKLCAQPDGQYTELVTGEYVDLEFPAEPTPEGMERTLVLKTQGYFLQWWGHQDASRPLAFGLNGNYPNPFNPSTTIRYSLAADAQVTLQIFNILGQTVRTLVDGTMQSAGSYDVTWDGRDEHGAAVGSGVYLYRLQAADFVETRKMIMLK